MIERLLENDMSGLAPRALSWAAGEISTEEFFKDMEQRAEAVGNLFIAPSTL